MRTAIALWTVLLLAPGAAGAQDSAAALPSAFSPGTRVRVVVPKVSREWIVGTVMLASRDTVVMDTTDVAEEQRMFFPAPVLVDRVRRVALPVRAVRSLEVSTGRSKLLGMLKIGSRAALVAGLISGVGAVSGQPSASFSDFGKGFTSGAVVGAVIGIPFGYARGAERWRGVPFTPNGRPRPQGVFASGASGGR